MPDLLLELFSEEIPARMQRQAADDLKRLVTNALVERNLLYEGAQSFATPRRLTLHVVGLPPAQADLREERKGPRVGAPEAAIQGFLKSAGLKRIEDARVETDPKKGEFYVALIEKPGRETKEAIAEIMPSIIRSFPWPKSMRWGAASAKPDALRWVRPLRGIVCMLATQHDAAEIVSFEIDGIAAGDVTWGHRFMAPAPIHVRRYHDYVDALHKAKVVLDADRRKAIILAEANELAFAQGLTLVEDEGLLEEVAGLVEWPVVLMGEFEAAFLDLPAEVIRATIRANQKCFVLRDGAGKLANKFIIVSNLVAPDGGAAIAAGNGRVVRARLADARHFWKTDLTFLPDASHRVEYPLDQHLKKLDRVVFHEKLGTQGERIARIEALARSWPKSWRSSLRPTRASLHARRARRNSPRPTLRPRWSASSRSYRDFMGRYYASAQGEEPSVADAIEEHYKPQGPNDRIPSSPVSIAVALADKLDTLVGFWAINEKPTGSKDPYALRRAALGVIRIMLENELRLNLLEVLISPLRFARVHANIAYQRELSTRPAQQNVETAQTLTRLAHQARELGARLRLRAPAQLDEVPVLADLLAFFADRLKVYLREKGARHDLIDAVFALPGQDDLLMIVRRVEALGRLLDTEDGKNLLMGYRRAANILRAEEKKDGAEAFVGKHDRALLALPAEKDLADVLAAADAGARERVAREDFEGAMRALATLRAPVDAFFLDVTVNADDPALRLNRLRLLRELREAMHAVADFSKVAG